MIRGALHGLFSLVSFVVVLYFVFFVPLGQRTLYQHVRRIAATEEAQELSREAAEAGRKFGDELLEKVHDESDAGDSR